ncbi:hypothetical protein NQZ68_002517 [Dissostichus eleginoides]|nr:hypothetical protein NQZ68_002517 [Dissostichus eleginoides]
MVSSIIKHSAASETLCLSSAAVPGLLSPRANFLASGGAEAIIYPTFHQTVRFSGDQTWRAVPSGGCYIHSLRHSGAAPPLLTVGLSSTPNTTPESNLIPETSGPDKPANEAFPAALPVCLSSGAPDRQCQTLLTA